MVLDNIKLEFIKKQLYRVHLLNDSLDEFKFINGLMSYFECSEQEIVECLVELERQNILKWDIGLIWMDEKYARFITEEQQKLGSDSLYF